MESKTRGSERIFLIEQIFESWEEYQAYYEEACKISVDGKRKKSVIKKLIRRYFEVEFKSSIKAPRYYYPEDRNSIVLQIPSNQLSSRSKGPRRQKHLDEHQHVLGTTEMYMRDQMAMRLKVMGVKVRYKKKKVQQRTQK